LDNPQTLYDAGFAGKSVSEQPKKVGDILLPNQAHLTNSPLKSQERPYRVITDKETFIKNLDLSTYATPIPKELDVKGFLKV
ncbi:hypothetical protein, partial [Helicobacter suis]|uniref:hypothetical protein n=1 Tax=Helicobacter suis TaxID=104628 RepID=UPI003D315595